MPAPVQIKQLKRTEIAPEQLMHQLALPKSGPWTRLAAKLRRTHFSSSLQHEFSWFFQGTSQIKALSVEEVCGFLCNCQYMSDEELFMERDFWQHPVTFEKTKMGDCDDHALWAWRKLSEIGIEAELVSGKLVNPGAFVASPPGGHAWVIFREPDSASWRVLEATSKRKDKMVLTPEEAKKSYHGQYSVDSKFRTYRFTEYQD